MVWIRLMKVYQQYITSTVRRTDRIIISGVRTRDRPKKIQMNNQKGHENAFLRLGYRVGFWPESYQFQFRCVGLLVQGLGFPRLILSWCMVVIRCLLYYLSTSCYSLHQELREDSSLHQHPIMIASNIDIPPSIACPFSFHRQKSHPQL